MIQFCSESETSEMLLIINSAAQKYKGRIPGDCWREPYMSEAELKAEIAAGVRFCGHYDPRGIKAVMGIQDVKDVSLIRHAYTHPDFQGRGIGSRILRRLLSGAQRPVLVGTWRAAAWAIGFYEGHVFKPVGPEDKDRLLDTYWRIDERQRDSSVVLADARWFRSKGMDI